MTNSRLDRKAGDWPVPEGQLARRPFLIGSLVLAASTLAGGAIAPAFASDSDETEALIKKIANGRVITDGGLTLTTPPIAENGNTVPVSVAVDAPQLAEKYVKAIHLFAAGNPRPEVASFHFSLRNGKAAASTRIRLAKTQQVIALAEMSDGQLMRTQNEVKVTIGGCGG